MRTIKICPDCGRIYVEGSEPSKVRGHNFKKLITKCNHIHEFEVDDHMIPVLVILWEKGYTTTYSCSGHFVHTQYDMDDNLCSMDTPDSMYIIVRYTLKHEAELMKKLINYRFEDFQTYSDNLQIEWESSNDPESRSFIIRNSEKYLSNARHNYEGKEDYDYAIYAITRYKLLADLMRFVTNLPDINQ